MNPNSNYLAIKVENHLFLKLFPIRVIVNDKTVYNIKGKKGIYTEMPAQSFKLEINNGFHYVNPLQVNFNAQKVIGIRVETYLSDGRLLGILALTIALFGASFIENVPLLRWVANIPILIVLGYAAFKRNKIILLSNLAEQSIADKYYENYDNIL
jgi:hypothetical protein